jgi:hypothetical protein
MCRAKCVRGVQCLLRKHQDHTEFAAPLYLTPVMQDCDTKLEECSAQGNGAKSVTKTEATYLLQDCTLDGLRVFFTTWSMATPDGYIKRHAGQPARQQQ